MMAMKPSVYIETSVISYYTARISRDMIVAAHQQITQEWWETMLPRCQPFISQAVLDEIRRGDANAAGKRARAAKDMRVLAVTDDVLRLADVFFKRLSIPASARTDSVHLATASRNGMAFLLTWNCRHLAAGPIRRIVSEICGEHQIVAPEICTPEQLMEL